MAPSFKMILWGVMTIYPTDVGLVAHNSAGRFSGQASVKRRSVVVRVELAEARYDLSLSYLPLYPIGISCLVPGGERLHMDQFGPQREISRLQRDPRQFQEKPMVVDYVRTENILILFSSTHREANSLFFDRIQTLRVLRGLGRLGLLFSSLSDSDMDFPRLSPPHVYAGRWSAPGSPREFGGKSPPGAPKVRRERV
ncbi:hypothetical protein NDU88_003080 [Pleurodeles waltl]|uniref:Uncharacterized protein n=1 Tax=Pleurodeles waltl TaxID=8319 RepID=A0AAV7M4C8_PLEWA|nr:hypothetical protein NDU88_003080 [Pleurodeles waltl]